MSQLPTTDTPVVPLPTETGDSAQASHVLVAGGQAEARELRETELRRRGYRVSVARTGFEAIVKATCHLPDLILLDDTLSDLDASETGRMLTTCPVTAHIPVVRIADGRPLPHTIFAQLPRPS